jgi:hypothetical protein
MFCFYGIPTMDGGSGEQPDICLHLRYGKRKSNEERERTMTNINTKIEIIFKSDYILNVLRCPEENYLTGLNLIL